MCFMSLVSCLRKRRIRIQILIVQILTMTFVTLILSLGIFISFYGTLNFLYNDAEQELIMKFIYQSTNSQIQAYKQNQQVKLMQGINQIDNFNQFLQLINEKNIQFEYQSEQCLQEGYTDKDVYFHLNQYCYGIFDCSKELQQDRSNQIIDMIQLSNMMTAFVPTQEGPNLYFTLISKSCYFSTYPGDSFGNYVPSQRPWFQSHLQSINKSNISLSQPYINIFSGVYQTLTTSLFSNSDVVGIGAIDLNFTKIIPTIGLDQKFLVITSIGEVVVCDKYNENSTEIFSLYNSSIFGFSDNDTLKILNSSSYEDDNCEITIPNTICVTDQNTGLLWYVRKAYISHDNWLLITFTSDPYQNYLNLLGSTLRTAYSNVAFQFIICLICICFVCFTINLLTFLILQQPIDKLINSCKSYKNQKLANKITLINQKHSDSLDKLEQAFIKLVQIQNIHSKNQQSSYKELNEIKYPINYYRNSKISKALHQLHVNKINFMQNTK